MGSHSAITRTDDRSQTVDYGCSAELRKFLHSGKAEI